MQIIPNLSQGNLVIPAGPKEMLSVRTEGEKEIVRINSSSLQLLQECPRKSYYLLERGLRKKVQNPATLFGSAIHKALEVFYRAPLAERILPTGYEKIIPDLQFIDAPSEALVYRSAKAFVEVAQPLAGLEATNKRSIPAGLWTLKHYFKTYIDDPFVVHADMQGPMVERQVSFTLFEDEKLRIEYFGTIDVVLKNERTGMILVADHKTSSIVGPDFFNRLKPNHQYTGYLLAAKRSLRLQTDAFLVNCLQVKPKPVTSRGTPPHFLRQVTRRDENDYREFVDTVHYYVDSYLGWKKKNLWALGHTNACSSYGGCQFLDVCAAPEVIRSNIIETQFSVEEANEVK